MLDFLTTLREHFALGDMRLQNLKYSESNSGSKKGNIVVQAVYLYVSIMLTQDVNSLTEMYKKFPCKYMLNSFEEFKEIVLTQQEDFKCKGDKIVAIKKWYGDLIENYEPKNIIEEIIIAERVCGITPLKEVGINCGLTPEAVRQKEISIQNNIINNNIGRIYCPEIFFYDCKYVSLFEKFVFPYDIYVDLCFHSPEFNSARRYYHYILKRSIKTDSKLPLSDRYVKSFTDVMGMLEDLDYDFSITKYKIFEDKDDKGNISYKALNPKNILFTVMKSVGEPIHPKELYFVYKDFVEKYGYGEEYEKPYSYFNWNIVLLKNVLKTKDRKVRYYDYEKYEDKFQTVFELLEDEFKKASKKLGKDKFLIRETNLSELKDILAEIDIHNEVELHSLIRAFYNGNKFKLGRCPVIICSCK